MVFTVSYPTVGQFVAARTWLVAVDTIRYRTIPYYSSLVAAKDDLLMLLSIDSVFRLVPLLSSPTTLT